MNKYISITQVGFIILVTVWRKHPRSYVWYEHTYEDITDSTFDRLLYLRDKYTYRQRNDVGFAGGVELTISL